MKNENERPRLRDLVSMGVHIGLVTMKKRVVLAAKTAYTLTPQPVKEKIWRAGDAILTPVAVVIVFAPMIIILAVQPSVDN